MPKDSEKLIDEVPRIRRAGCFRLIGPWLRRYLGFVLTPGLILLQLLAFTPFARAEELWIFDTHAHMEKGEDVEKIVRHVRAAGVRKIAISVRSAQQFGTDDEVLKLHAKYPDLIVPVVSFQQPGWLNQEAEFRNKIEKGVAARKVPPSAGQDPRSFLDEVEAKLKTGKFRWMGELALLHPGGQQVGLHFGSFDISPDTDLFRVVLDISARYGVPITIHHNATARNVEIFRRALRHNPEALVVWGHWCGRAMPKVCRSFLQEFPNLYTDLSASVITFKRWGDTVYGAGFGQKQALLTEDGAIRPEWKEVILAFPDRFLAGIDALNAEWYERYGAWVAELRQALTSLPPNVAQGIAFENAERLLTRWKGPSPSRPKQITP